MVVAYDLGSNSLRVLIYDDKRGKIIGKKSIVVGTSVGLYPKSYITQEAIDRILHGFVQLHNMIDKTIGKTPYQVDGVATASFRIAHNAKEVLNQIYQHTGVSLRIISGDDESYYTMIAVRHRLQQLELGGSFCLCDIGGASTEIIYYDHNGQDYTAQSFDIGIVTLCDQYSLSKEDFNSVHTCNNIAQNAIFAQIEAFAKHHKQRTKNKAPLFVATAGTPTILANLLQGRDHASYDATFINGTALYLSEVKSLQQKLLHTPTGSLRVLVGEGREDFIFMGILIFTQLYKLLGYENEQCIAIDDGVSEGVAIDYHKE